MTIGYLPQEGLELRGAAFLRSAFRSSPSCATWSRNSRPFPRAWPSSTRRRQVCCGGRSLFSSHSHFRAHNGYALDAQVGSVLSGLGFSKHDWSRQTEEFSGGWQWRIALAKLLLQKPSLLLLDEPTNHLDLETRNWLEDYLHGYPNGYILISHDRYFLDVTVDKTIEIWNKGLHVYHGNYEKYLVQKTSGEHSWRRLTKTSANTLSILRPSSAAFAIKPPRLSRCRAASRTGQDRTHRDPG